ncbi:DNA-processing protein DprA [Candidatus Protochlamydia phocaeensis]|uniref:DNA-processing protein DprA n=1 Tax=Candidatus Protochlamydia phocaeensis TaxID=1414722 RepID=UPI0008391B16|nr:DNA-processing protein DprA [Candidatus Protochlamydia phocaeensis]
MNELEALVILTSIPYLGSIKIRLLIECFGSAIQALQAPLGQLAELPGFGPKILSAWQKALESEEWKDQLKLAERLQVHLIAFNDPRYPKRLLEIADYPLILYNKGEVRRDDQRCIAVVGTRHATLYGMEMARQISRELAQAGFTIISGLARGIDTAAHQGALEGGRTIAVLGSGIARLYPGENAQLARQICEQGAVISEFPLTTPPDRTHFPQRNRIVSGMSLGTLLIEAPRQSGAMLTMERALQQGRRTFALPGRADQETFCGNHALIKEKKADLIENARDIIACYDNFLFPIQDKPPAQPSVYLEKEEMELLCQLPTEELSIEEIARRLQLPISKISILLMSLVLKKIIKEYPGKIYKKI